MKSKLFARFAPVVICALLLFIAWSSTQAYAGNSRYLVMLPHTPEECLKTLDGVKDAKLLSKFDWGCMTGDHTGYAVLEAKDEAAVKKMLPASAQTAKIIKVDKFSTEQIKAFHEKK